MVALGSPPLKSGQIQSGNPVGNAARGLIGTAEGYGGQSHHPTAPCPSSSSVVYIDRADTTIRHNGTRWEPSDGPKMVTVSDIRPAHA